MAVDKATAIAKIKDHREERGGDFPQWYVGITDSPERRLFKEHAVEKEGGVWIYNRCVSSETARAVERHFLALGMKGDEGGGDDESAYVYAYKITRHTVE
jgi:hypothetical protein